MFLEYKNLFLIYSIGLSSIIFFSAFTYFLSNKFSLEVNKKNSYFILFFSVLFYTSSILYLSFGKINALHHYVDFATILEILWRNSQGFGLTTLMSEEHHESSHWFSAHFTPIIYLTYIPFFTILPKPYVLPLAETIFILSALIPLWLISKKFLDNNLSRVLICSFLFYPTIFYTNLYGPAFIELCLPLFLWLFYFFEEKKNKLFILTLFLCLMIREEVSLVTCFFGIFMCIRRSYFLGLFTIILSLIYFYVALYIIMPSFKAEDFEKVHVASRWFNEWGNSLSEMILNILLNPIDTLKKLLTPAKIGNFVLFLIPLLFTPFLNIMIFLIALPNLAISFLSYSISHSSFILYYLSPSIAVFYYASINGISKIKNFKLININSLINAILVASITSTIFFGATPISIAFWNKNYYVGNFYTTNFHRSAYIEEERDIVAKKIINKIPKNAIVSAELHFLPLLYNRKKMIIFPSDDKNIDYVIIDRLNPKKTGGGKYYLSFRLDPESYYQKYLNNSKWSTIFEDKGITLLKKNNL